MRISQQNCWAETKQLQCAQQGAATDLENFIGPTLRPDPQVLGGHRTPSIFSFVHIRKATYPLELTSMDRLLLDEAVSILQALQIL